MVEKCGFSEFQAYQKLISSEEFSALTLEFVEEKNSSETDGIKAEENDSVSNIAEVEEVNLDDVF